MKTEKRKLIQFGNYSLCITLPKDMLSSSKLRKGDSVMVTSDKEKGRILIELKPAKPKGSSLATGKDSEPSRW